MKYVSALKLKLIYVFRINDDAHKGCLKVGEATCDNKNIFDLTPNCKDLNQAAKKRINKYTQTAGIAYELLYTELAIYNHNGIKSFNDKEVHNVLERSGIRKKIFDIENKANEWFITDLTTVKRAIAAVKEGKYALCPYEVSHDLSPIIFRPEQLEAIKKTQKQFQKGNQMLWNAKMRFGKTLSALQVVKDMNFQRTLILTHRPVVNAGWFEDFKKFSMTDKILHMVQRAMEKYMSILNNKQPITDCIMYILHQCRICAVPNLLAATLTKIMKFL